MCESNDEQLSERNSQLLRAHYERARQRNLRTIKTQFANKNQKRPVVDRRTSELSSERGCSGDQTTMR